VNEIFADILEKVRKERPLIHNITNYVVMNFTANALLAMGSSPVMAHALQEVEEMVSASRALVANIGTLSGPWVESMIVAARRANEKGIPVVLDPVGAGATRFRTETAQRILSETRVDVVRGNASEIMALQGMGVQARGVDSFHTMEEARKVAVDLALRFSCIIAVTGEKDFVTDGSGGAIIANGDPLMSRVTGTGCAASAIAGAFCAVEENRLMATAGSLVFFGLAGEMAAKDNPGPGTFQTRLLDALSSVARDEIMAHGKCEVEEPVKG